MTTLPSHDLSGRTEPRAADSTPMREVPSITTNHTGLTATEVAGSVCLLDAVRAEGRSRRLVTALMVLCWLETETPELEYAE